LLKFLGGQPEFWGAWLRACISCKMD